MVFTPAPSLCTSRSRGAALQVGARKRPQDVPDHLGLGQLAVERVVVVLGAEPDVEPIRLGRKEFGHLVAGNEVGEDFTSFSAPPLAIHLAMVSACSLRAPGVVK